MPLHHSLCPIAAHGDELPGVGAPGAAWIRRAQQKWAQTGAATACAGVGQQLWGSHPDQNQRALQVSVVFLVIHDSDAWCVSLTSHECYKALCSVTHRLIAVVWNMQFPHRSLFVKASHVTLKVEGLSTLSH